MNDTKKSQTLQDHLQKEHKQSPLAEYLREIVYGGNDGIVTTFAVVAGFSGASFNGGDNSELAGLSFVTVLLFGLANLFADGLSMGLGNYLSINAEKDVYRSQKAKERKEIRTNTDMEAEETKDILMNKGFSAEDAQTLTNIYSKNEDYWVDWMMNHELEVPNPETTNPFLTAVTTLVSFITFGSIPLLPYLVIDGNVLTAFLVSSFSTLFALILLGIVKWKVIGNKFFRSIGEVVFIGGIAALVAFIVGVFFRV